MTTLKVCRGDFENSVNSVERANKDYSAAIERVAATNKKFQFSAGGLWAIAQGEFVGTLEHQLRVVGHGLGTLSENMQKVGDAICNELFPDRDSVFTAVGTACAKPEWAALMEGGNVASMSDVAEDDTNDVSNKAQAVIDACGGLEDSSGVTGPLETLKADCATVAPQLSSLSSSYTSCVTAVDNFSSLSTLFGADNFVTVAMRRLASKETSGKFSDYDKFKIALIKEPKTYISAFNKIMEGKSTVHWLEGGFSPSKLAAGEFWVGWRKTAGAKLVSDWKNLKADAGELGKAFSSVKERCKSFFAGKRSGASLTDAAADAMDIAEGVESFGSKLSKAGRYLGYAGDVLTIGESAVKAVDSFSRGDFGQGLGQLAKGAAKVGVGRAIGALAGSFGGPAGVVVGMAVGGLLGAAADAIIDEGFKFFGVTQLTPVRNHSRRCSIDDFDLYLSEGRIMFRDSFDALPKPPAGPLRLEDVRFSTEEILGINDGFDIGMVLGEKRITRLETDEMIVGLARWRESAAERLAGTGFVDSKGWPVGELEHALEPLYKSGIVIKDAKFDGTVGLYMYGGNWTLLTKDKGYMGGWRIRSVDPSLGIDAHLAPALGLPVAGSQWESRAYLTEKEAKQIAKFVYLGEGTERNVRSIAHKRGLSEEGLLDLHRSIAKAGLFREKPRRIEIGSYDCTDGVMFSEGPYKSCLVESGVRRGSGVGVVPAKGYYCKTGHVPLPGDEDPFLITDPGSKEERTYVECGFVKDASVFYETAVSLPKFRPADAVPFK